MFSPSPALRGVGTQGCAGRSPGGAVPAWLDGSPGCQPPSLLVATAGLPGAQATASGAQPPDGAGSGWPAPACHSDVGSGRPLTGASGMGWLGAGWGTCAVARTTGGGCCCVQAGSVDRGGAHPAEAGAGLGSGGWAVPQAGAGGASVAQAGPAGVGCAGGGGAQPRSGCPAAYPLSCFAGRSPYGVGPPAPGDASSGCWPGWCVPSDVMRAPPPSASAADAGARHGNRRRRTAPRPLSAPYPVLLKRGFGSIGPLLRVAGRFRLGSIRNRPAASASDDRTPPYRAAGDGEIPVSARYGRRLTCARRGMPKARPAEPAGLR